MTLNLKDSQQLESKLVENSQTPQGRENVWVFLHSYFLNATPDDDKKVRLTLFRWYTDLTWKRINLLSNEDFVNVAFGRQVPLALLLGFDIQKILFDYLNFRCPEKEDMVDVYAKTKNAFMNSEAFLGSLDGIEYGVKDIIPDIKKYNLESLSTLEKATITEKLTKILFPKKDELFNQYIFTEPTQVVDWFIGLVNFFMGVKAEDIKLIVDGYNREEDEEIIKISENNKKIAQKETENKPFELKQSESMKNVIPVIKPEEPKKPEIKIEAKKEIKPEAKKEIKPEIKPTEIKAGAKTPEKTDDSMFFSKKSTSPKKQEGEVNHNVDENLNAPKALTRSPILSGHKKPETTTGVTNRRLSYKEIRKQLESRFAKDSYGHFLNVTDVLNELQKISVTQEDPHIKDLYYFNEQAGGFEWNENLLKD
ncbi:MAG: hypothetical protein WC725_04310 [Patescibacteria group bacterium]|jgi:hypothetical protein